MIEFVMNYLEEIKEKLKNKGKFRIAFVGDSLTSCEWIHPNWREIVEYVVKEELQKEAEDWKIPSWGIRCFNFGFDGSTTRDILKKVDEILEIKPDLVISLMGGNDPLFGITPTQTKENLENIFGKFNENNIGYAWATSLPDLRNEKNKIYQPYREETLKMNNTLDIFEWYKQWNLEYFFTFKSEENIEEGIKEGEIDPIHPNQIGNAYIAKYFMENVFGINFDPEKYIKTNLSGNKYPEY